MYAVVDTGGKQSKVEQGSLVAVEKLNALVGETVSLPVIMLADGERVLATPADIARVSVTGEVVEHFRGDKQVVFKFKKRKGYKRTKGHRQSLTSVRIMEISVGETPAKPAKKAPVKAVEETPKPVAAVEAQTEAAMCAATKSDGAPCANKAKEGSAYCGVHAKKHEG